MLTSFNFTRGQVARSVENVEALPKCEVDPPQGHTDVRVTVSAFLMVAEAVEKRKVKKWRSSRYILTLSQE